MISTPTSESLSDSTSSGDLPHGIDVEPRIDLIEDRHLRICYRKLKDLRPLLLAPRQSDIHRSRDEAVHSQPLGRPSHPGLESVRGGRLHFSDQLVEAHARYLNRVLERLEQTRPSPSRRRASR